MWTDGRIDMTKLIVALRNTANAPNKMRSGGVKVVYSDNCRQSLIVDLDVTKKKVTACEASRENYGSEVQILTGYFQQIKPVHDRHRNFV
jgi:hypothetical protein